MLNLIVGPDCADFIVDATPPFPGHHHIKQQQINLICMALVQAQGKLKPKDAASLVSQKVG